MNSMILTAPKMSDLKLFEILAKKVGVSVKYIKNEYVASRKRKEPVFGCAKGQFVMSKDFDEPLDDFKDYM